MKLGFIGLGAMGRPMALHLMSHGHSMGVYARRAASAAPLCDAPRPSSAEKSSAPRPAGAGATGCWGAGRCWPSNSARTTTAPLRVGIADSFPKTVAHRLLAPALQMQPAVVLVCTEDKTERLLAELAVRDLDLVLSDAPLPPDAPIRAAEHARVPESPADQRTDRESGVVHVGGRYGEQNAFARDRDRVDGGPNGLVDPQPGTMTCRQDLDGVSADVVARMAVFVARIAEADDQQIGRHRGPSPQRRRSAHAAPTPARPTPCRRR